MPLSSTSRYGLLDSDCRLAAMARVIVRVVRSTMYEMKFGLIGFAIGTTAITGVTLASAPKQPVVIAATAAAAPAPVEEMLWPVLPAKTGEARR
jgi:hypothetical protein